MKTLSKSLFSVLLVTVLSLSVRGADIITFPISGDPWACDLTCWWDNSWFEDPANSMGIIDTSVYVDASWAHPTQPDGSYSDWVEGLGSGQYYDEHFYWFFKSSNYYYTISVQVAVAYYDTAGNEKVKLCNLSLTSIGSKNGCTVLVDDVTWQYAGAIDWPGDWAWFWGVQ